MEKKDKKINKWGYNINGLDKQKLDKNGYNLNGYNTSGHDSHKYNINGYNTNGYDRQKYSINGYNRYGLNRQGKKKKALKNNIPGSGLKILTPQQMLARLTILFSTNKSRK